MAGGISNTLLLGSTPHPVTVANEGLVWDSLLKMVHKPGGDEPASWVGGRPRDRNGAHQLPLRKSLPNLKAFRFLQEVFCGAENMAGWVLEANIRKNGHFIWVFPPKWMVYFMENPMNKWMI